MDNLISSILFWILTKKDAKSESEAAIQYIDDELDSLRKNLSAISACELSNGQLSLYIPASYGNIKNGSLSLNFTD